MVSHSPGMREDEWFKFTSVSSHTDLGGVGRGGSHVDQDLRLLAGVAKPASGTVCEVSHRSPSAEELSSPDLAGKRISVIPAGMPLPASPVGPCGMTSPSDLTSSGPVGPIANPVGPYVTRGLVGSYRMLSLCNFVSYPDQPVADGPVGPYVSRVWDAIPV